MYNSQTLQELGLKGLNEDQKKALLDQLNVTLQTRVDTILTSQLSEEDLEEFGKIVDAEGDEVAQKWVEGKIPGYKDIVAQESKALLDDIKQLNEATEDEIAKQS